MKLFSTLRYRRLVLAGMLIVVLSFGAMVQIFSSTPSPQPNSPTSSDSTSKEIDKDSGKPIITTPSGLKYVDLVVGKGDAPKTGDVVSVNYVGKLQDGTKFDSSYDRGKPIDFKLGFGQVIKGWDEGLSTMKVGGKRKLIIPPQLGYGMQGAGDVIPPNATLFFEVELVAINPK